MIIQIILVNLYPKLKYTFDIFRKCYARLKTTNFVIGISWPILKIESVKKLVN